VLDITFVISVTLIFEELKIWGVEILMHFYCILHFLSQSRYILENLFVRHYKYNTQKAFGFIGMRTNFPTKVLRSKRRSWLCIFQVVVSLPIRSFLIVTDTTYTAWHRLVLFKTLTQWKSSSSGYEISFASFALLMIIRKSKEILLISMFFISQYLYTTGFSLFFNNNYQLSILTMSW
jgi:hypothetical protein